MAPGRKALSSWMTSLTNGPARSSTPNTPLISTAESATPSTPPLQSDEHISSSRNSSPSSSPSSPSSIGERRSSRPTSMIQPFHPPVMEVTNETIPELQPIFTYLNSHSTKLYQEGYFLKLHDRDPSGRPTANRTWTECFAQLVGTVLSLWDASQLDHQRAEGEVTPSFINLSDASIKLIDSLATRSPNAPPLQNVLSVSTAGNNLYLFHFSSHHAMVQWAAAIRLAMFEQSCLQESYTGSLIAGKGRSLVGIGHIMQHTKFKTEDWVRVRFGAGTPWRRCWCVVTPPDEKQIARDRKLAKKSAYQHGPAQYSKGVISFFETKKTKKITPIATIHNAHSVYALYPQSKHLIEQSTLVKIEGQVTIHAKAPATSDGIVFVMPEVHPGITGFETMIRFLFRAFDVFALYGRPGRLVADPLDSRSLMFAMPRERSYGCLTLMDVASLLNETDSKTWSDGEWRKKLKQTTAKKLAAIRSGDAPRRMSMHRKRSSLPSRPAVKFDGVEEDEPRPVGRVGTAPIGFVSDGDLLNRERPAHTEMGGSMPPMTRQRSHRYSDPESRTSAPNLRESPPPQARRPHVAQMPPMPPAHAHLIAPPSRGSVSSEERPSGSRSSTESIPTDRTIAEQTARQMRAPSPNGPVATPPQFSHASSARPPNPPRHSFVMASEKGRISDDTLAQLANAGGFDAAANAVANWRENRDASRSDQNVARIGAVAAVARSQARSPPPSQGPPVPMHAGERKMEQAPPVPNHQFDFGVPAAPAPSPMHPTQTASTVPQAPPSTPMAARVPPAVARPRTPVVQEKQLSPPPTPPNHYVDYPSPTANLHAPRSTPQRFSFEQEDSPTEPNLIPAASPHDRNFQAPMNTPLAPPHDIYQEQSTTPLATPPYQPTSVPEAYGETSPGGRRYSITRKPVPATPAIQTPMTSTSLKDLRSHLIDEDALSRIIPRQSNPALGRQEALAGPLDKSEFHASDFQSSRPSESNASEKPRAGVLKVVGAVDAPGETKDGGMKAQADRLSQASLSSPQSQDRAAPMNSPLSAGRPQQPANVTPGGSPHHRDGSSPSYTPEGEPRLSWMPGMARPGSASGNRSGAITPEQFVQQRAAMANQSMRPHAHSRNSSGQSLGQPAVPSPLAPRREFHGDLPSPKFAPRTSSAVGVHHSVLPESPLSAREQEHISRMTGAPLVDISKNQHQGQPNGGLVGIIAQRDREKKALREGYGNIMSQGPRAQSPLSYGRPESPSYQSYPRQYASPNQNSPPIGGPQQYQGVNQGFNNQAQYGQGYPQEYNSGYQGYSQNQNYGYAPHYGQAPSPVHQQGYAPPRTPPAGANWTQNSSPASQYYTPPNAHPRTPRQQ